jgi:hypothetical protein
MLDYRRIRIHNFDLSRSGSRRPKTSGSGSATLILCISMNSTKCCLDKGDIACEQSNTFAVFLTEISAISAQRKS